MTTNDWRAKAAHIIWSEFPKGSGPNQERIAAIIQMCEEKERKETAPENPAVLEGKVLDIEESKTTRMTKTGMGLIWAMVRTLLDRNADKLPKDLRRNMILSAYTQLSAERALYGFCEEPGKTEESDDEG